MEKLDFQFIKDRGVGELISDYLNLFKKIFKHFNATIFRFLLPLLAVFLILIFFLITYATSAYYKSGSISYLFSSEAVTMMLTLIPLTLLISLFYFLFISPFGFEYIFLLKEKEGMGFDGKDVWNRVLKNVKSYLKFFLTSILIFLVTLIPIGFVIVFLAIIPLLGTIAIGLLISCLTIIMFVALFLYLKREVSVFDCYKASFALLKKKLFIYGVAAYLFRTILDISSVLLSVIPAVIFALIIYNSIGFTEKIFTSFSGKMMLAAGSAIVILFFTIATIYGMSFYTLIFFSSLEATNKEATLEQINKIGQSEDEEQ